MICFYLRKRLLYKYFAGGKVQILQCRDRDPITEARDLNNNNPTISAVSTTIRAAAEVGVSLVADQTPVLVATMEVTGNSRISPLDHITAVLVPSS